MKYTKKPETPEQCCLILKERGIIINDQDRAIKYLRNVGYFRLTGYMFHLQSKDGNHTFIDGTKFEDIIALYQFDKKLRGVISEYLERNSKLEMQINCPFHEFCKKPNENQAILRFWLMSVIK